jgi:CheY-like chemotaxis protein
VLGIIRSHDGFVTVASRPGQGTTFTIHLPAALDKVEAAVVPEVDALPRGRGELILVVDDEAPIRAATSIMLERHGYRVLTASEGVEALATFLQNRTAVRLVLTDVVMPVMGGVALTRALRLVEPKLKVIATSGLTDQANQIGLGAAGADRILAKPCDSRELLGAIHTLLSQSG